MTTLTNLPSIFVPLVGLVFPTIVMASLSLHVQKKKVFLNMLVPSIFFFKT